eukprot:6504262-Pyramimonas_sp.AAC.1
MFGAPDFGLTPASRDPRPRSQDSLATTMRRINYRFPRPYPAPPKQLAWRVTQPYAVVRTAIVNIFFGGAPYGATRRVLGVPKWVWGCMWTVALGPSVEHPMGPRNI